MTHRPASLVSVVNSCIGSQENVDNLFPAAWTAAAAETQEANGRRHQLNHSKSTTSQRLDNVPRSIASANSSSELISEKAETTKI
jgi:hypothetical protein